MAWFWRRKGEPGEERPKKVMIAEGLWVKCESCKEIVYRAEVDRAGRVCPKCRYPFRIGARERIASLVDEGSFEEREVGLRSRDPLGFKDTKKYTERLKAARSKTGLEEAVVTGVCRIGGYPVAIAVFEFNFLGGSMASVVGEKLTRTIELAIQKRLPLLIVSASGGARMQEGILSLMQMAKTSAALQRLAEARLPYLSLLTDPTTGGVTASFAMLGDVILAEPRALIGFAGPRVIAETIRQPLPEGFQRSEFLLEHGQIDLVVERRELRETLRRILGFFCRRAPSTDA
jgi:acetyl-CoA carboxylase carboxyl transferase subunit beta